MSLIYTCHCLGVTEGNTCARLSFLEGDDDDDDEVRSDRASSLRQIALEKAEGARDRDTARTINGVLVKTKCTDGLSCVLDECASRAQCKPLGARARTRN